mmetsp:Transcript_12969/g.27995  ORF Transcript_12969/g.27995 Transcript_12969/m.27995 type:complete len:125 (+) Transcript_12969:55-429(+)
MIEEDEVKQQSQENVKAKLHADQRTSSNVTKRTMRRDCSKAVRNHSKVRSFINSSLRWMTRAITSSQHSTNINADFVEAGNYIKSAGIQDATTVQRRTATNLIPCVHWHPDHPPITVRTHCAAH